MGETLPGSTQHPLTTYNLPSITAWGLPIRPVGMGARTSQVPLADPSVHGVNIRQALAISATHVDTRSEDNRMGSSLG